MADNDRICFIAKKTNAHNLEDGALQAGSVVAQTQCSVDYLGQTTGTWGKSLAPQIDPLRLTIAQGWHLLERHLRIVDDWNRELLEE